MNIIDINELPFAKDWSKRTLVILGRGEGKDKYVWNPEHVDVFSINDSLLFYPGSCQWSVIVQAHFAKNFRLVNGKCDSIIYLTKARMVEYQLVVGCTPSLFISYLLKYIPKFHRILLQGFSMDGVSSPDEQYPYDWDMQLRAFKSCFEIANARNAQMGFVTPNPRMTEYPHLNPYREELMNRGERD